MKVSRPGRPRARRRAVRLSALAAGTALLLTACGDGVAPGVAARVGDDTISAERVDAFAQVLCGIGALPGTESGTPTRSARYRALEILLANELAADVADLEAVDRATVNQIVEQTSAGATELDDDLRAVFDEVAREFALSQTAVIELGREALAEAGQEAPIPDEEAYAEGERLRTTYAATAEVEVDPRFGTVVDGVLQPGDGSLSVPVTELAQKAGDSTLQPDEAVVGQLPASQKCS